MASVQDPNSPIEITETHSESQSDVTTQLDTVTNGKTYNILLLGETGVGKSTFINAFFQYITYESLDDALKAKDITALVPTKFTMMDEDYNEVQIVHGEDENESYIPGASATQSTKSYVFKVGNSMLRLIDTPGIGDTEGTQVDEENFDRLLISIGELEDIHAICITLKPNNARLTVVFQYCMKQLLSRLETSACRNIVFLFTNSRSTLYRPGDTVVPVQEILKDIAQRPPNVVIPFQKKNVFCIDNEAFRFLIAKRQGIDFNDDEIRNFAASWNKSSKVYLSMLNYITKLKPHKIQDTISINEARRLIVRLSQPLSDVTHNIDNNLEVIRRHKDELSDGNKTIEELKKKIYIPIVRMQPLKLEKPRTVCTHAMCTKIELINGIRTVLYTTLCHNPCYLNDVAPHAVGDTRLSGCYAMEGKGYCNRNCGHNYMVHMHDTYENVTYPDEIKDANVCSNVEDKKNHIKNLQNTIDSLEERKLKYENEKTIIQKSMAKFAHFLTYNAITAYNDKYSEYLDLLIDREISLGDEGNKELIERYTKLKKTHEEEKAILDDTLEQQKLIDGSQVAAVTAKEIIEDIEELYKLELTGSNVKDLFDIQESAIKNTSLAATEQIYTPPKNMIPKLKDRVPSLFKKML